MSVTSGFFNSISHDRLYNTESWSKLFSSLMNDGIFGNIGDKFTVRQGSGLTVTVGSGRAWLRDTWTYNDSDYPVTLENAHVTMPRIDAIVLVVDKENRQNYISKVTGTPAPTTPSRPTLVDTATVKEYPLAYISVPAGTTQISQSNIQNVVGTTNTGSVPYITGILKTADVSSLYLQWQSMFEDWFESVKDLLDDVTAATIQTEINNIKTNGVPKLTTARKIDGVGFNGTSDISHYGVCSTAGTTAAKTVSISNFSLVLGAHVFVKFTAENSATIANLTLNVNNTGAKPIRYKGVSLPVNITTNVYLFVYDGTNYELVSTGMESQFSTFVPVTRTINGKQLNTDISLTGSDINFSSSNNSKIPDVVNNKVDKVSGKALSTNDFTNAYKTKLDGIADGANAYSLPTASSSVLGGVKVGSGLSISGGTLSATPYSLPTASGSTLGGIKVGGSLRISNGKLNLNNALELFYIERIELAAVEIAANSYHEFSRTISLDDVSEHKYYPVGVVGQALMGNGLYLCTIQKVRLEDKTTGQCTVKGRVKNLTSSKQTCGMAVDVLWFHTNWAV